MGDIVPAKGEKLARAGLQRQCDAPTRSTARMRTAIDCVSCKVRGLTFCGGLAPRNLGELASITVALSLPARRPLFHEGDPAAYVYNLRRGVMKLYRLFPDGRRQITGFLQPGGFLGLASRSGYSYSAETITAVELCRYPRHDLIDLFTTFPGLERRMLELATDELVAAQDQMLLLGCSFAAQKVALFLLHCLERETGPHGRWTKIVVLPMSRGDIADYLGLTPETLSRTLAKFTRDGLIRQRCRSEIELLDLARLTTLSSHQGAGRGTPWTDLVN